MRNLAAEIVWRFGIVSIVAQAILWACVGDGPVWGRVHDPEGRYPPALIEREAQAIHDVLIEFGAWPPIARQVLDVDLYVRGDLGTFRGPDGETWTTEGTAGPHGIEILSGLSEDRLGEVLAAELVDHRLAQICTGDLNAAHDPWWGWYTQRVYARTRIAREEKEAP